MKKFIFFGIFILALLFVIVDLFHPGFPLTHDGQDHIARIANFYANLQQGVLIPRWAANLNWGYGHPILEFLYPFPSYLASLFHGVGFSLIDATKIVFGLGMVLSGIAMFLWIGDMWGIEAGLVGGVLYMYAPYRLVDLYVRGDIGENLAFAFIPLVMWCMYRLFKTLKLRYSIGMAVSLALLILSHNAISLMVAPLILFYGIYLTYISKKRKTFLLLFFLSFCEGFLLAAFFWVPALLEGKFTLRNIVTKGAYLTSFVNLQRLVMSPWSYGGSEQLSVQVGVIQWAGLILSLFVGSSLYKTKEKARSLFIFGLLLYTLCALFLMLPMSNFLWERIMLLQNFQFPWRFLAIPVITSSILVSLLVYYLPQKVRWGVSILVVLVVLAISKDWIHAKAYVQKPESFFTGIYNSTTDTGESAPIWSVRFMEKRPPLHMQVVSGKGQVEEVKRTTVEHDYLIQADTEARFVENTLYFPGWKVLVDGKPVDVQFQDPKYRGLMTFSVVEGKHTIKIVYSESKLRLLGDFLSLLGLVLLIAYGFGYNKLKAL